MNRPSHSNTPPKRRRAVAIVMVAVSVLVLLVWWAGRRPTPVAAPSPAAQVAQPQQPTPIAEPSARERPTEPPADGLAGSAPWRIGAEAARFTFTLYADFECAHCKAFLPVLLDWIERHPDTALLWQHQPLAEHQPVASQLAELAECAGQAGGDAGYWHAAGWIFEHTRGNGAGLPDTIAPPDSLFALRSCDTHAARQRVEHQARTATQSGVAATPTLHLNDGETGRDIVMAGPQTPDALLSALDWAASEETSAYAPEM